MTEQNNSREKMIEKIRKVLAYTTSPNQHEAAAAAAKAADLLTKYNIDITEVRPDSEGYLGGLEIVEEVFQYSKTKSSPLKSWKEQLAVVLSKDMQFKVLVRQKTHLVFIGTQGSVTVGHELFNWLVSQLQVAAAEGGKVYMAERETNGDTSKHVDPLVYRNTFFMAAVDVIGSRLYERRANAGADETAMVLVHTEAIDNYVEQNININKSKKRRAGGFSSEGYAHGRLAGERANLG